MAKALSGPVDLAADLNARGRVPALSSSNSDCSFRQASFDELALEVRKISLEKATLAGNVVAVGPQAGKSVVHRRHPLTVITTFLWARALTKMRKAHRCLKMGARHWEGWL